MLLGDEAFARQGWRTTEGRFAFAADDDLLLALGRCAHAFMGLRWEALWLHGVLTDAGEDEPSRRITRADPALLALRLQAAAHTHGHLRRDVSDWADAFAAAADVHADVLRAHPGTDSLWSLPTDTPEALTLADRSVDLLEHAERFERLTLRGQRLRRALGG